MLATILRLILTLRTGSDIKPPNAKAASATLPDVAAGQRALAAEFDYTKASRWPLGFAYFDDSARTTAAIGMPGLIPLQVLMLGLADRASLQAAIDDAFFMGSMADDDPAFNAWLERNADPLRTAAELLERSATLALAVDFAEGEVQDGYIGLATREALDAYADAWVKSNARAGSVYLSSSERRVAFYDSPVMGEYIRAAQALAHSSDRWALDWLEACGFKLLRDAKLVSLEGYQPLFLKLSVGY